MIEGGYWKLLWWTRHLQWQGIVRQPCGQHWGHITWRGCCQENISTWSTWRVFQVTRRDVSSRSLDFYWRTLKKVESWDLEGIYKDITRNTVYVVEWSRTKGWRPCLSFYSKFKRVVQIF
jgi:hypothetical protein